MSDGDNATPGRRRRAQDDGDNQWLTRSRQPLPGAAPWERADRVTGADPTPDGPTGNHTDGVTVADLIARMASSGEAPVPRRSRHRADPEPDPEPFPNPSRSPFPSLSGPTPPR